MLLELPDPCLLVVMQYCALDGQSSLFSAARAHSKLHQAAVLALSSISAAVSEQQQVDSVLLFLSRHGQHIDSINFQGEEGTSSALTLRQLPQLKQLSNVCLQWLRVQLHLGDGCLGMMAGALPLKQLHLSNCRLLDSEQGLAAALAQLPKLEHLSLEELDYGNGDSAFFGAMPLTYTLANVLQHLQCLTYLELVNMEMQTPRDQAGEGQPRLQHLQLLTRLADLRVTAYDEDKNDLVTASMLSGAHQLTRLQLSGCEIEPGALAGKTRLQHLQLHVPRRRIVGEASGLAELLLHLQHMQQLTHLDLQGSLLFDWLREEEGVILVYEREEGSDEDMVVELPAATFGALTASSKLQYLNISGCLLPVSVWPHIFPAGRQLPHLRSLEVGGGNNLTWGGFSQELLRGCQLVSCCPSLHSLNLEGVWCSSELFGSLQGLSCLRTLLLHTRDHQGEGLEMVCQLTGLQDLTLHCSHSPTVGLLQLTQLQQLTRLDYLGKDASADMTQAPGDRPVWRQVMQRHLDQVLKPLYGPSSAGTVRDHKTNAALAKWLGQ